MNPKSRQRVALYVRVSTLDQSCDLQKSEAQAFIELRGWCLHGIYEDKATGTNTNRPRLKELLQDARRRRFDAICVWKLDRFARSLKDLVVTLQELSELGIHFVSLKDNIDFTTSSGRLMLHIIGAFAEFEASLIKERVRAGLSQAKRKGVTLGRPKLRDDDAILALRRKGLSYTKIQRQLGMSRGSIYRALKSVSKTPNNSDFQTQSNQELAEANHD